MSDEIEATPAKTKAAAEPTVPSLLRNYVSFVGAALAAAGFVSIVLMLLLEFVGGERAGHNPYTASTCSPATPCAGRTFSES